MCFSTVHYKEPSSWINYWWMHMLTKLLLNPLKIALEQDRAKPTNGALWIISGLLGPENRFLNKITIFAHLTFSAFSRKYRDIFANDFRDIWEHDSIFFSSMKGVTLNVLNDASWRNKFGVEHKNSIKDQLGTQNGMFSL